MKKLKSKYLIKVPKNISLFYCKIRRILFVKGVNGKELMHLKLKLYFINCNTIYITNKPFYELSNKEKKNLKSLRGTTYSLIKKLFYQVSYFFFKKLLLKGVGYKVLIKKACKLNSILEFKLGKSHNLYYKTSKNVIATSNRPDVIYITGINYNKVSQTSAVIRKYKTPEPYKGKGIIYQNEVVKFKLGKKV